MIIPERAITPSITRIENKNKMTKSDLETLTTWSAVKEITKKPISSSKINLNKRLADTSKNKILEIKKENNIYVIQ